jgi:predicted component of type VI protein secretion system
VIEGNNPLDNSAVKLLQNKKANSGARNRELRQAVRRTISTVQNCQSVTIRPLQAINVVREICVIELCIVMHSDAM